ncbi:cell wall-binding repeat-containing protein [Pedococcus cremeus]|uniref:cell wall-binding repeat-containing protein n=1 Tax=Pedococcus cremeus TaxID=587636 RepID=UPI000B86CB58
MAAAAEPVHAHPVCRCVPSHRCLTRHDTALRHWHYAQCRCQPLRDRRKVSQKSFSTPQDVVYVASGESFPDALAAGPAAARDGAPILLV